MRFRKGNIFQRNLVQTYKRMTKKYALERSTVCLKRPFLYSFTRYENEQDFLDILYTILYVDRVKSKGLCSESFLCNMIHEQTHSLICRPKYCTSKKSCPFLLISSLCLKGQAFCSKSAKMHTPSAQIRERTRKNVDSPL